MTGFRQRMRERMMISDLEEEDSQPKSPVESSYNLSRELHHKTNQKTCFSQASNATVLASQEQQTSFHDETVVSFNPPAYSTICEFSESDSSPGCRVSETDSSDVSDSLYRTTIEPPEDTLIEETKGMGDILSGMQSLQLKSMSPCTASKPRRSLVARALLSDEENNNVMSPTPVMKLSIKKRKSLAARALLSEESSSDNESQPCVPVSQPLSVKKRKSMAARALVLSDSDDDISQPSSVSRRQREALNARLQHILSTCKKKKSQAKRFPALLEESSDSISAVNDTPEILASESASVDTDSKSAEVKARKSVNLLESSDSISIVRQTPEILASESTSIETDTVNAHSNSSESQVVPESNSLNVNNMSLQVSLNSPASQSPTSEQNDSASHRDVSLQVSLQSNSESLHQSSGSLRLVLSPSVISDKEDDASISGLQSALKKLTFSPSDTSADSPVFTECQSPSNSAASPQLPPVQSPEKDVNYTSSDGDSDFENFIQSQKKAPRPSPPKSHRSLKDFIVDDLSSDEEASASDESLFYARTDRILEKKKPLQTPSRQKFYESENGTLTNMPRYPSPRKKASSTPRPLALANITNSPAEEVQPMSFLASLTTNICGMRRHPDAQKYVDLKRFCKVREELSARLFKLFNETVFDKQLPEDFEIKWNVRMTKTAGCCAYYKKRPDIRVARIEFSCKVCDSAERLRDTMIHEMCHAAVWLIQGERDGHGPLWQLYARRANRIHSDIPKISRCHNYWIQTKYTYKCTKCGYEIGRHSKSLDTVKKVCGYCQGTFEVFINTPRRTPGKRLTPANRTPNPFAQFVKENYARIKQGDSSLVHKDIMRKLSEEFKSNK